MDITMKKLSWVAAIAALAGAAGSPLGAQEVGLHATPTSPTASSKQAPLSASFIKEPRTTTSQTIELGVFAQYTHFDENAGIPCGRPRDKVGVVGRMGVFTSRAVEAEADAVAANPERAVVGGGMHYSAVALRLNYNLFGGPFGPRSSMLVGLGAVRASYVDQAHFGVSGITGMRFALHHRLALRLDEVADYIPDSKNLNIGTRLGLSLLLGRLSRDADTSSSLTYGQPTSQSSSPMPLYVPMSSNPPASAPTPLPAKAAGASVIAAVATDEGQMTSSIYFDYDKATVRPEAAAVLDKKIDWLKANPGVRIRIEGNSDERGSNDYNTALAARRADAAKRYLVQHGIDAARFEVLSFGKNRPICDEKDEACWKKNRRGDFLIVALGNRPTSRSH